MSVQRSEAEQMLGSVSDELRRSILGHLRDGCGEDWTLVAGENASLRLAARVSLCFDSERRVFTLVWGEGRADRVMVETASERRILECVVATLLAEHYSTGAHVQAHIEGLVGCTLADVEERLALATLKRCEGDRFAAASVLDIVPSRLPNISMRSEASV